MSLSHLPLDRPSRWTASARSAASARTVAVERRRSHYRNMALWTLQGWLAMFFIAAGYAKLTRPMELLVLLLGWPVAGMERLLIVIGVAEILLAVGVLAPLVSWRIGRPVLMAALVGLLGLTAFMAALHAARAEAGFAVLNLILAGLAATVLIGRGPPRNAP